MRFLILVLIVVASSALSAMVAHAHGSVGMDTPSCLAAFAMFTSVSSIAACAVLDFALFDAKQEARDSYWDGKKEGFNEGHKQGVRAGRAEARKALAKLEE